LEAAVAGDADWPGAGLSWRGILGLEDSFDALCLAGWFGAGDGAAGAGRAVLRDPIVVSP
jgi:hypothetical protein